eukprot:TRINITY_DN306_c0_g1_i1.p1 TRINITY_DN306_c0_g1~~TRINITY_DN306_c0_g1_i1.p1  ORF type:complete len:480 (+),score=86.08 TRINITY_DN306_c0_g1_i1:28-1440(+)
MSRRRSKLRSYKAKHYQSNTTTDLMTHYRSHNIGKEYEINNEQKEMLIRHICSNNGSFAQLDNAYFQQFLNSITKKKIILGMTPETISNKVKALAVLDDEITCTIIESNNNPVYVLSIDGWDDSVGKVHCYGVTVTYLDTEWELKSRVLDLIQLEANTGDAIAEYIEEHILPKYFSGGEYKLGIISDHGGDIKRAKNLLLEKDLISHEIGCAAHLLHLNVLDAIYKVELTKTIIMKIKKVVSFFNSSTRAYKMLLTIQKNTGTPEHRLIQSVDVRWLSFHKMIERYIEQKECIASVYHRLDKTYHVTNQDILIMEEFFEILRICSVALRGLEGDKYATSSLVLPTIYGLKNKLRSLHLHHESNVESRRTLLNSLNLRINRHISEENLTRLKIATAMDIRFKSLQIFMDEEKWEILEYLRNIYNLNLENAVDQENCRNQNDLDSSLDDLWQAANVGSEIDNHNSDLSRWNR